MNLNAFIRLERGNATTLAEALGIPLSYLSQMSSGDRAITPQRASEIELHTQKAVTRQEMRPDDWQAIWPELAPETFTRADGRVVTDQRKADRRTTTDKA